MSHIQALEAVYHSNQDRVLFTLVMTDNREHKFWLTRRYSKLLLNALDQLIKTSPVQPNNTPHVTAEAFAVPNTPQTTLLAANLTARSGDQASLFLGLFDEAYKGLEISASKELYASLEQLLKKTFLDTGWDF